MNNPLDAINSLWRKKEKPDENPAPIEIDRTPWVRVGLILRSIPFRKLLPAFASVPVIVFLTLSGLIAWLAVLARFAMSIFTFGS